MNFNYIPRKTFPALRVVIFLTYRIISYLGGAPVGRSAPLFLGRHKREHRRQERIRPYQLHGHPRESSDDHVVAEKTAHFRERLAQEREQNRGLVHQPLHDLCLELPRKDLLPPGDQSAGGGYGWRGWGGVYSICAWP